MTATPLSDAILRMVWTERRISRAEIAQRAELSRSTVSEIVEDLLATGLVEEAGVGESRGGRRPILLEFQDDAACILGVDMGASHVAVVRTNLRGDVLDSHARPYAVRTDPDGARALVKALCDDAMRGVARDTLMGIGIAVPSPVDPRHPDRLSELALPDWGGRHGFRQLLAKYKVPILVDNDANCGALAEHWWGGARGLDDFTYIKVATGIGAGHFIGGKIRRGASGVAGEIGHVTIDSRGEPCVCGNRGCLTTVAGGRALERRAMELRTAFPQSVLAHEEPTLARIEQAAMENDPLALQVVHEAAEYLGIAIAGVLNLLNPSAVILGGGLAVLGDKLLVPLRASALRRTFVSAVANTEIRTSELGLNVVAIGAATLVLNAALADPTLFPTVGAA
ncbi:ROK family transcriptional regulator [Luteitalea sp.]|uniref:ROK family transcriptional regulator n=1 Tax=Luteitalea sp. TaxID=2004800 RepID=UPI0025BD7858|nr:ROK family transcriptional regulator [Luteitalea sp.]